MWEIEIEFTIGQGPQLCSLIPPWLLPSYDQGVREGRGRLWARVGVAAQVVFVLAWIVAGFARASTELTRIKARRL